MSDLQPRPIVLFLDSYGNVIATTTALASKVGWGADIPRGAVFVGITEAEQGRDTSAADVDGAKQSIGHHESVGERQGRQPAPAVFESRDKRMTVTEMLAGVQVSVGDPHDFRSADLGPEQIAFLNHALDGWIGRFTSNA